MAPHLDQMAQDFADASFAKFDCGDEANKQYALEAGIKALPTFHLYRGGQKVGELTGAQADKLRDLVKRHI